MPEGFGSVAASTIPMNVSAKAKKASAIPDDFLNAAMPHLTVRRFGLFVRSGQWLLQYLQQQIERYVAAARDEADARRRVVDEVVRDRRVGRRRRSLDHDAVVLRRFAHGATNVNLRHQDEGDVV